ncbi:MAG: hypothetical protein H0W81_06385 [Chloroflexi bacterium]|nr:hypothetical protein [Chloroflexota bacterium]
MTPEIIHDPIRDALRQLVREKRIYAWNVTTLRTDSDADGPAHWAWTVCLENGATTVYTSDQVIDLLGMYASEREAA